MQLGVCLRAVSDPVFAEFTAQDTNSLTQDMIDEVLGQCYCTREEAMENLTPDTVVLCTHRDQVPSVTMFAHFSPSKSAFNTVPCRCTAGTRLLFRNSMPPRKHASVPPAAHVERSMRCCQLAPHQFHMILSTPQIMHESQPRTLLQPLNSSSPMSTSTHSDMLHTGHASCYFAIHRSNKAS